MIIARWVNLEQTTLEATIDGVTSYVVRGPEGDLSSQDNDYTAATLTQWIKEGNNPLPYYQPGG